MMSGKEKIYFLLNRIDDVRQITPSGQPLKIDLMNNLSGNYRPVELEQLFSKLEKDDQILKVLKTPSRTKTIDFVEGIGHFDPYEPAYEPDDGCWHIELLPAFNEYFAKIQNEPEYQEFTGKKPASRLIKPSSDSLMTYEDKLGLIVKAIVEASKIMRKGVFTATLYLNATSGLDRLPREEIHNILLQLQDENALKVHPLNNRLLPPTQQPTHYFLLDVPDFDSWYEGYLMKQKTGLKNLDYINMLRIYDVTLDINEQIQLTHKTTVTIHLLPSIIRFNILFPGDSIGMRDKYCENRWDSLKYLKEKEIIDDFKHSEALHRWQTTVSVSLKLSKFDDFYKTIRDEYIKRNKSDDKADNEKTDGNTKRVISQPAQEKTDVVYEIIYTKQRQILMNNAQIGKPDFNSENDLVFSFLYAYPNENHTKEQIEKTIGVKLNKSLHKIVENLGFEGDTKEVFISVSKNAIQFRNPITKKDLEDMKKPLIKLIKGGGKLILPH